jgi:hypothetical protein
VYDLFNIPLSNKYRLLAALYIFLVYATGVFLAGAWSDDYSAFQDPKATGLHAIKDGRILYGGLIQLLFSLFNSISGFVMIRLFGLIGLILLNDLVISQLSKVSKSLVIPIATSVAFTLPSFQFSSHWAIAFAMSWAAYLSVLGFVCFRSELLRFRLLSLVLVLFSVLLYPLMSFFVIAFVYAEVLISKRSLAASLLSALRVLFYLAVGMGIGTLFAFLFLRLNTLEANPRVAFVSLGQIPEKLLWFFTRPFALSFRPYLIDSPSFVNVFLHLIVFTTILIFLYKWHFGTLVRGIQFFISLLVFLVLSILPLLAASQNQIDLRFIGSNSWIVLFAIVFLGLSYLRTFGRYWISGALVIICLASFLSINRYFASIRPVYTANNIFIADQLQKCRIDQIVGGIVILRRTEPWVSKPLLGLYSQTTDFESEWVPVGAIQLYLKEQNLSSFPEPVMSNNLDTEKKCPIRLNDYD